MATTVIETTSQETEYIAAHQDEAKEEDEQSEEEQAVISMQESLSQFQEALHELRSTSGPLAQCASDVLEQVAEAAPQLAILSALVGGGALAGNPVAQAILHSLTAATHALVAPGAALTGGMLIAGSGIMVGIGAIVKLLQAKTNKNRIQAVNDSLTEFKQAYLDELDAVDNKLESQLKELTDFIQAELNAATEDGDARQEADFVSAMKFNGILTGIGTNLRTFHRLIRAGNQQLKVIVAAAEESKLQAETSYQDGKDSRNAGVIVFVIGGVIAIGSGGTAIPVVAGVAAAGGAVAAGAGMFTMSLAEEQLADLKQINSDIESYQRKLDGYQDKLEGHMKQFEMITKKLGGDLSILRQLVAENKAKEAQMRKMQEMMDRMQEEMNRMRMQGMIGL